MPIGLWDVESPTFSLDNRLTNGGKFLSLRHLLVQSPTVGRLFKKYVFYKRIIVVYFGV
jgi:hypothetical protein